MEFVSCLLGEVVKPLLGVAKTEISYMWNYSENVGNLKTAAENLRVLKETLEKRIDDAKGKAEVPGKDLEKWMQDANIKLSEVDKFIAEAAVSKKCCNLSFCVDLGALYRDGKMATTIKSSVSQLQAEGNDFKTCVFLPLPSPVCTDLYQRKNLDNISSHKSTLKDIVEAIKDKTIQIVAIVGFGGVGKTTLANEAAKELKNQFEEIVFITVSEQIDTEKIKQNVQVAAKRILNQEKVLIILDDVWEELKLYELGIPYGSDYENCKILLTSRREDVCKVMNAKIVPLLPLKEEEAWTLFKDVVGKSDWDDDDILEVARKIVTECWGLPLYVQVIGKALKSKKTNTWEAVLRQLQALGNGDATCKTEGIRRLKLSYDFLEDKVAKSCFLLCGMFPEDKTISLKTLTYYGLGLGILNNPKSIQDAKDRVLLVVESLKSSFLLLPVEKYNSLTKENEEQEEFFKMHDLIREMALFITSKEFLVQSKQGVTKWQPGNNVEESYKKISLMGNKIRELHDHKLVFPHLDTFLIQDNVLSVVPDEFFLGMKEHKVLDMSGNDFSSLPQSPNKLTNLRTLDLSRNKSIREISILGELTRLEILKLRSTGITKIPKEIGQLINLRLLDVNICKDLSYITPGVISKLILLEELYVWLLKDDEGGYEFLVEISELESLKVLHLKVPLLHLIPEDSHFETLIEFCIRDNDTRWDYPCNRLTDDYKRSLQVSSSNHPFTKPILKWIRVSEALKLWSIKDLDNIIQEFSQHGFYKLKDLELVMCENVRSLVHACDQDKMQTYSHLKEIKLRFLGSLQVLCDNPRQCMIFHNLVIIVIEDCPSLLKLFPLSVALRLVNLREVHITDCKNLVAVISTGDCEQTDQCDQTEQTSGSEIRVVIHDTDITFPLTRVILYELPKLECFYSGHSTIKYPLLKYMVVNNCPGMMRWSYGESHMPQITFNYTDEEYCGT